MPDDSEPSVRLFSYYDDQPNEQIGSLIPLSARAPHRTPTLIVIRKIATITVVPVVSLAAVALMITSGYGLINSRDNVALAPTVTVFDSYSANRIALSYGPQAALSQSSFFAETRDAFIEEGLSFIEVDLDASILRYFKNGVLIQSAEILAKGEIGSWWDAPSGLYKVESKDERQFSSFAQTYLPWSITFEGNYAIHGKPQLPDNSEVQDEYLAGGIRLSNEDAEALYKNVDNGVAVLVHKIPTPEDSFVYEPLGPQVSAKHFLVADIDNGTILTSSDLHSSVPIASLTKLMTAVIAAEKMSLDQRVRANAPTFVESLIPRLAERNSVSMYSLLQLLLVESSNESAEIIAGEYGRDAFIEEMNTKARQVGMFDTAFTDPSGLSAGNTSSLSDLFQLTRYIHTQRNFIFEITATGKAAGVQGGDEFSSLVNFNEVQDLNNFVGGKIGETTAAGKTSVSLHDISIQGADRTVVVILLGAETRNDDVKSLVNFVESKYSR